MLIAISVASKYMKEFFYNADYVAENVEYKVSQKNFFEKEVKLTNAQKFELSFNFVYFGYRQWDNLFEIKGQSPANKGVRIEFAANDKIGFVLGGGKEIVGTALIKIEKNRTYNFKLTYENSHFYLETNGEKIYLNQSNNSLVLDVLSVGYGFSKERYFNGEISDFTIVKIELGYSYYFVLVGLYLIALVLIVKGIRKAHISDRIHRITPARLMVVIVVMLAVLVTTHYLKKGYNEYENYKNSVSKDLVLTYDVYKLFFLNEIKKDFLSLNKKNHIEDSDLEEFHISIKREYLKKLNSDLPQSGKKESYRAYLKVGESSEVAKIKLRYRGEGNYHWYYKQKSLRIKMPKNNLYKMERKFNLINTPYYHGFRDVANYKIARELGLISPDFYPVKVFLNGEYMGVYMYMSQVDESLVRKHRVMPGSVYYGDSSNAPINKYGATDLWFDQKYWVKKAARNKEQKEFRGDIEGFVNGVVNTDEKGFYEFFRKLIDNEKFYNFIALDRITGSNHHDFNHNHKIYFDPYRGKFEPIEWDLRFWNDTKVKDESVYPLVNRIKYNPVLDFEADKVTYALYQKGLDDRLLDAYKTSVDKSKNDLEADVYKDTAIYVKDIFKSTNGIWFSVPYTFNELYETVDDDFILIKHRKKKLYEVFNKTDVAVVLNSKEGVAYLDYYVSGNTPVVVDFSQIRSDVDVYKTFNNKDQNIDGRKVLLYPGRKKSVNNRNVIMKSNEQIVDAYEHYSIKIGDVNNFDLSKVKYTNALTGAQVIAKKVNSSSRTASSIHPWSLNMEVEIKVINFDGIVSVDNNLEFSNKTEVVIAPGTEFKLAPGKSIFFYGKVKAIGTKQKPIKFTRKEKDAPWGSIVIQGRGTASSALDFIEVKGGSTVVKNLISYTAQFNIHDTSDFLLSNCIISSNSIGDDSMHVAYSSGTIKKCAFLNAFSDALDIDISDVTVDDNIFYSSGNDGLDIMTTKLKATNNIIAYSNDKGVSVGEWSEAILDGNLFFDNNIGIAAKDKSTISLDGNVLLQTKQDAISAYNKNKRYDEGGKVSGWSYIDQKEQVKLDKKSTIEVDLITELPDLNKYSHYYGSEEYGIDLDLRKYQLKNRHE